MPRGPSGGGSVYPFKKGPKQGKWCAQVFKGYSKDGKRLYARRIRDTKTEAEREKRRMLAQQAQGRIPTPQRQTVAQFLQKWLETVVAIGDRESTERSYRWASGHVVEHLGRLRVSALDGPEGVARIQAMYA